MKTNRNNGVISTYIQFSIDNGYKEMENEFNGAEGDSIYLLTDLGPTTISIYGIITSKPFIEAIARGINTKDNFTDFGIDIIYDTYKWDIIDKITFDQAIHIREGTLDLFIKELLGE